MPRNARVVLVAFVACVLAAPARAQESLAYLDAAVVVASEVDRFETLAHMDGDDFADAIDMWMAGGSVGVSGWINDGAGRLVKSWSLGVNVLNSDDIDLAAGNIDGDGWDDFVLGYEDAIRVYTSNGAALPTLLATLVIDAFDVESIVLADFDNDGLDDIAWSDGWVTVLLNQGRGIFVPAAPEWNLGDVNGTDLIVGDIDGDGWLDISNQTHGSTKVYFLEAGVVAANQNFFLNIGIEPEIHPTIGDVDLDGDNDVMVFNEINSRCALIENSAGLVVQPWYLGGPATHLFDIDVDGDLDGLCCGGSGGGYINVAPSKFVVSHNDGEGRFAQGFKIHGLGAHHLAGAADLDHDGDIDLVGGRCVYYARDHITTPIQPEVDLQQVSEAGMGPGWVADGDSDGDPDVGFGIDGMITNWGDGQVVERPVLFVDEGNPADWLGPGWPGDWDGDGDVDLVVTKLAGGAFQSNHVLWNNGSGVLRDGGVCHDPSQRMSPAFYFYLCDVPSTFESADVDADGDLDVLAFGFYAGGSTRISLNDGSGWFTTPGADLPGRVQWVGDLDGDQVSDLLLNSGTVSVAKGLGSGLFGAPVPQGTPVNGGSSLAVIDIEDDGDLDVVGLKYDSLAQAVFFNDGRGNFTVSTSYFIATTMYYDRGNGNTMVVDVNRDGRDDLLFGPARHGPTVSWVHIRKVGEPGFLPAVQQVVLPTAKLDADGDGDLDLLSVMDTEFFPTEALVRNSAFRVPEDGLRRQYGQGAAGTGGVVPVLGASGPFRLGEVATIILAGLPGPTLGLISVGLQSSALPNTPAGATGYNFPWEFFALFVTPPGEPGVAGSSRIEVPLLVDGFLVDAPALYHQIYLADPGHPFGISVSAGLVLDYQ